MSGPKIFSAFMMSLRVTGQFRSRFISTIFANSLVVGRPIIFWMLRARTARALARVVIFALLSATVLIMTAEVLCMLAPVSR